MNILLLSAILLLALGEGTVAHKSSHMDDPNNATYAGYVRGVGTYSTNSQDGFVPGLYITTANIPGGTHKSDGSLVNRKIVLAHQDWRTSGGSVVIPWGAFDKRDGQGGGYFDWDYVEEQMKPWTDRGQMVNLLVWPAIQKKDQIFEEGAKSATPESVLLQASVGTFKCPKGSAQGGKSGGIPLPRFWKPDMYMKYAQALKVFVERYENRPEVNYFRFGIGVGAESYPANGATTPNNYCMKEFVKQFEGDNHEERAEMAYITWSNYVKHRILAFRRFNSKKPIVVTINEFSTSPRINGTDFSHMIAHEATKDYNHCDGACPKLGLGVQGATTNGIDAHSTRPDCYANWCSIFNEKKHLGIPLQIQTPLHSGVNGRPGPWQEDKKCSKPFKNNGKHGCTTTGNLAELIDYSLSVGVNAFELYSYEWCVANDVRWKARPEELNWHVKYGKQYSDALDRASNHQLVPHPKDLYIGSIGPIGTRPKMRGSPTDTHESLHFLHQN